MTIFKEEGIEKSLELLGHSNICSQAKFNPYCSSEIVSGGFDFTFNVWRPEKSAEKPYLSLTVMDKMEG